MYQLSSNTTALGEKTSCATVVIIKVDLLMPLVEKCLMQSTIQGKCSAYLHIFNTWLILIFLLLHYEVV